MRASSVEASLLSIGLALHLISICSGLVNGGHYRIRSLLDGLYATAGTPTFKDEVGMELGEVTTEKWTNFREQRWDVIGWDHKTNQYWVFAQENPFNKMSASTNQGRPDRHVTELVPVALKKYLIRSVETDRCLQNPGYGLKTAFAPCDPDAVSQQWEFDLLTTQ